jgi:hypothetical protein
MNILTVVVLPVQSDTKFLMHSKWYQTWKTIAKVLMQTRLNIVGLLNFEPQKNRIGPRAVAAAEQFEQSSSSR